jgi:enoyl-CoA hydratase/carnithine racemase
MNTIELTTTKIEASVDDDGIGWITFNNPARHNALSLEMWQGLAEALEQMQSNTAVRVAVMTGAGGKAFVSGADISEFDEKRSSAAQKETYAETAGRANRWLARFDKPLLAMIAGYCIGGGLATSLAADVRFATPDSKFGIPAAKLGLGYDYDGIAKLARLVGPSRARDILFSARTLGADEALRIGLVDFVVPRETLEREVIDYARRIGANAPLTVRAAKAAVAAFERGSRADEIAEVQRKVNACFDSEDYKEGRQAFAEKRPPQFKGR